MGSLFSGFAYYSMRKIGTSVNATITTFFFGVFSAIGSFIMFAVAPGQELKQPIDALSFMLLVGTGMFGWLA